MTDHPQVFLASEVEPAPLERARFHVIPAPLERTVSYGTGARQGPAAILEASQQLELFDGLSCPGEEGVHTATAPDLEGPLEQAVDAVAESVNRSLAEGGLPILLGGEHTVSVGAFRALRHRGMEVGIIQVDAHADLREHYEGTPLSHACVMRRAVDLGFAVHQLGVRSLSREEQEFREASDKLSYQDARDIWFHQRPRLKLPDNFPESVHLSLDLDGLDASLMPATGTPEPGGLFWGQLMALLDDAARTRRIVSADVVELAPVPGLHGCDYLAAKLVYAVMGLVQRGKR